MYILSRRPDWNSSRNNVARNLNIKPDTATEHIKILEALNMLVVDRTNESWSFEVCPPEDWITVIEQPVTDPKSGLARNPVWVPERVTTDPIHRPNRPEIRVTHNTNTNRSIAAENSDLANLRSAMRHPGMLSKPEIEFGIKHLGLLENGGELTESQRSIWLSKMLAKIKYADMLDVQDSPASQEEQNLGIRSDVRGIMLQFRQFSKIKLELEKKQWNEDFRSEIRKELARNLECYSLTESEIQELENVVDPSI